MYMAVLLLCFWCLVGLYLSLESCVGIVCVVDVEVLVMDVEEVILKLYWRTDGLPISGVFCLQGKVSFLHLLHNLLKTEHQ